MRSTHNIMEIYRRVDRKVLNQAHEVSKEEYRSPVTFPTTNRTRVCASLDLLFRGPRRQKEINELLRSTSEIYTSMYFHVSGNPSTTASTSSLDVDFSRTASVPANMHTVTPGASHNCTFDSLLLMRIALSKAP